MLSIHEITTIYGSRGANIISTLIYDIRYQFDDRKKGIFAEEGYP